MVGIAVWIVLPPPEMIRLRKTFESNAEVQDKLDHLGTNMGKHLRELTWELIFFAIVFFLVIWLFNLGARLWTQGLDLPLETRDNQRLALAVVARNLLLYPIAIMYGVVLVRHYLVT